MHQSLWSAGRICLPCKTCCWETRGRMTHSSRRRPIPEDQCDRLRLPEGGLRGQRAGGALRVPALSCRLRKQAGVCRAALQLLAWSSESSIPELGWTHLRLHRALEMKTFAQWPLPPAHEMPRHRNSTRVRTPIQGDCHMGQLAMVPMADAAPHQPGLELRGSRPQGIRP